LRIDDQAIVTAVVVAFHGDRWLKRCVEFLQSEEGERVKLVIGDNYGNERISEVVDGRTVFSVRLPGPLGFAEANNLTLTKIRLDAPFICFLNQDTKSPRGWLSRAADFLDQHQEVGAITPLISTYEEDAWDPSFLACTRSHPTFSEDVNGIGTVARFVEVAAIPAPAMVVRTAVLKQVGGFDPIYGSYYEDYDLCHRIRTAGFRVGIWTGATIAHYSGSASGTAVAEQRRQRLIVRNRIIYRVRTAPRGRARQLAVEVFRELPRQLARRILGRAAAKPIRTLLGGYSDALRLLPRLMAIQRDERARKEYFEKIGWPSDPAVGGAP
jgi:GT2 family glycosyltransferase